MDEPLLNMKACKSGCKRRLRVFSLAVSIGPAEANNKRGSQNRTLGALKHVVNKKRQRSRGIF
jgi:hypothetical protein